MVIANVRAKQGNDQLIRLACDNGAPVGVVAPTIVMSRRHASSSIRMTILISVSSAIALRAL